MLGIMALLNSFKKEVMNKLSDIEKKIEYNTELERRINEKLEVLNCEIQDIKRNK